MKIYTRTGDHGETGLFGGARVWKNDSRVEAYGTIDELNALLGMARAGKMPTEIDVELQTIQNELFVLGAEVACTPGKVEKLAMRVVDASQVERLESLIDRYEAELPTLTQFILPAGTSAGAALHFARTVARRAERRCLEIKVRAEIIVYLNRLSDALFVMARRANQMAECPETPWVAPSLAKQ